MCIGGANVDVKCRIAGRAAIGSSNPGAVLTSPGGVARNIAENLARLGCRAALISAVGRDDFGECLIEETAAAGVDVEAVMRTPRATGSYVAMLDRKGELIVATADMEILEQLTPRRLARHRDSFARADLVVADSNLPIDTLDWLLTFASKRGLKLAIETVSVPKGGKLRPLLTPARPLFALFCNQAELAALSRRSDLREGAQRLHALGVGCVGIGLGRRGMFVSDRQMQRIVPARRGSVIDVTGAGDAAVAGTLFGLLRGLPLARAAACGQRAAALTVRSERSVSPKLTARQILQGQA